MHLESHLKAFIAAITPHFRRNRRFWLLVLAALTLLTIVYSLWFAAPSSFVPGTKVKIVRGTTTLAAAEALAEARVIAHPVLLRGILSVSGKSEAIQVGTYRFSKPQSIFTVAYRLVAGEYGFPPARLTFVEGTTVREMAEMIAKELPDASVEEFLELARSQEGYLFPDTYILSSAADAATVVNALRANFDSKILPLLVDVHASGHSLSDMITMASLIEREARDIEDKRMIAGILWNRIAVGMPLQVDAVFGYIKERATYSPSYADLKIDSPYNTYTHKGLPPGPICSPGLESIEAALNPIKTDYLYYLTGKDGKMHYATTYQGHQNNLKKYLN